MTRIARAVLPLLLSVTLLGVAVGCGDSDNGATSTTTQPAVSGTTETTETTEPAEPPEPAITTITVRGEQPVGGVARIDVKKGDTVKFAVASDSEQEVHVHGYDIKKVVPAGGKATFSFKADIDGSFEVELEGPGVQIANLRVNP